MRVKMVGLGKCGSRTVLDFYAVVHGQKPVTPTFRFRGKYGALGEWMSGARRRFQSFKTAVSGHRNYLPDPAEYIVADVDETNDVLQIFQQDSESKEGAEFLGKILRLHDTMAHGCGNFHILGQGVMRKYLESPRHYDDVIGRPGSAAEGTELFFICFSLGGGTGGGSAIELAHRLRQELARPGHTQQTCILGVGVMPELFDISALDRERTDQEVDLRTDPSRLGYSAGRFMLQQYARLHGFDGLLLISNNIIPNEYLTQHGIGLEDFHGKMNEFLANIIREVATQHTKFLPEIDSADVRDLKTLLGGEAVIAGFARRKLPEKRHAPERALDSVAAMIVEAISPVRQRLRSKEDFQQPLHGLSVDVEMDRDFQALASRGLDHRTLLSEPLALPREFRQAKCVAAFYGVPRDDVFLPTEREFLHHCLQRFFPNALREVFSYHHLSDQYVVTILISGLFGREALWDVYQYLKQSWIKPAKRTGGFEDDLDALVVGDEPITREQLRALVSGDTEVFHSDLWPDMARTFEEVAAQLRAPSTYFTDAMLNLDQVAAGLENFRLLGKRGIKAVRAPRLP
ncbi:MAG: hypothetical protein HY330_06190 [Chloroflexi bacterium]|nr:hypothetical protein [Chloroflexota bacterium]